MGVRGLETFLQKEVPDGVFLINVLDEIDRWRSAHPDQPIVLVFQVVDLMYNIFLNLSTTEILCGPAFKKIRTIFDDNFRQLAGSDAIELHFFVNEPAYHKDFKAWTIKESKQYSTRVALLEKLDSNVTLTERIPNEPGAYAALPDLLEICKIYGTVHVSFDPQYIADVAQYSNEKRAMAIVGNNSDFLIFNGAWRYWSCRDIDLMNKNWNTLEFNRDALLERIGLSRQQMPMFATIVGNNYIPYDQLIAFHKSIGDVKFLKLAEYVQLIPSVLPKDEKEKVLLDLFGSCQPRHFEMVRKSLHFYAMKKDKPEEVDPLSTLAASISAVYYNSLKGLPIRIKPPTFYDLRRKDFSAYSDIVLPILKRQIGFVRKDMNDISYQQVVELRLSHSERIKSVRVTPDYPSVEIPELLELSINQNNDYYNGVRFKLLKWMIFGDDIPSNFLIQLIPEGYMVTVVAVMFLCKLKQLTSTEANAILFTIHSISVNEEYAKDFVAPINISSRDVIASHLYIFVHNTIVKCFQFLGLNDFVDYLSIDGVYFVHWVNNIKADGDSEATLSEIEYLKQFLRFV